MHTPHPSASAGAALDAPAVPVRGYLSGHFDLVQIADLDLIHAAKRHCDHLTVGVATDESHLASTGQQPVVRHADRLQIVAHLRSVDAVVADAGGDIVSLWQRLRFEVLLLGPTAGVPEGRLAEWRSRLAPLGVSIVGLMAGRESSSELLRASRRRLDAGRAA